MKNKLILLLIAIIFLGCGVIEAQNNKSVQPEVSKKKVNTPFTNPIMWADMPDLSIIRTGSDYYLISTTMHLMPGAPVMHSKDLVH